MPETTSAQLLDALRKVQDPDLHQDIVSLGFVKKAEITGGVVSVTINLTTPACPVKDQMKAQAEGLLRALPGVKEVKVEMTAEVRGQTGGAPRVLAPDVRHILAVSSGKGGVGKSTFSVNLACALAQLLEAQGRKGRVGLLDCDIYGPSVPLMMGLSGRPEVEGDGTEAMLIPMERHGVKVMSMGFLVDDNTPVVWRGPMIMKTVQQFVQNVKWGELDVLLIDLPPGTGDAQLSLVQTIPLDGAVLVTTPQPAATNVARKGGLMFQKVNVPLLGVAENMSYFVDPAGQRHELFGAGGGIVTAEKLGTTLLGQVPLIPEIRAGGDSGMPIVVSAPQSAAANVFREMGETLLARLQKEPGPTV